MIVNARRDRLGWIGLGSDAAALWSLGYGLLAASWSLTGRGYPFGPAADPEWGLTLLGAVPPEIGAPAIAGLSLIGAAIAVAMVAGQGHGLVRKAFLAYGFSVAVILAALIPDYRVLVIVAYTPIFLLGAPFGWPSNADLLAEFTWPLINQLLAILGGMLWAAATIRYRRRTSMACEQCGRNANADTWMSPAGALAWGRWAVAVAVVVPVLYAITRWAWALGIPLGVSDAFLREGDGTGMWLAGALLGTLAVVGAGLTVGLVRPWGEVLPGWVPVLGGRRVAPAVAIVPASLVAVVVTAAGMMFVRLVALGGSPFGLEDWGALAPELLWPIWGVALGLATLSYHYRRRGRCRTCGRGGVG